VTKYSGSAATGADGKFYRLINCRDIYCTIDVELFEAAKRAEQPLVRGAAA
jgi:hypothetical protein